MKSILSKNCCKKEEKPFPKLMEKPKTGSIWLMESDTVGTCVHAGGVYVLSEQCRRLDRRFLEDYEGDVCLTNED